LTALKKSGKKNYRVNYDEGKRRAKKGSREVGFLNDVFEFLGKIFYHFSDIYPALREAAQEYINDGYKVSRFDLFSVNLYKETFWGTKTVKLCIGESLLRLP